MARTGLLMDWGGVIYGGLFESFAAFCTDEGIAPQKVRETFRDDPEGRRLLADFESGRLDDEEFEEALAARLGVADPVGLIARLFGGMYPDEAIIDVIRRAKAAGVKTGLLSNSWGARTYPQELLAELFDVLVISGELGCRKPEQRIYDIAVERMALPAEQLVFVDDLPGNLKPARAMGILTIVHRDAAETVPELERALGL